MSYDYDECGSSSFPCQTISYAVTSICLIYRDNSTYSNTNDYSTKNSRLYYHPYYSFNYYEKNDENMKNIARIETFVGCNIQIGKGTFWHRKGTR